MLAYEKNIWDISNLSENEENKRNQCSVFLS